MCHNKNADHAQSRHLCRYENAPGRDRGIPLSSGPGVAVWRSTHDIIECGWMVRRYGLWCDCSYRFTLTWTRRQKMICSILLLINLTSCFCGTFVVNVTQTSYQAEENDNITLEWTFTTNTDSSLNSLYIYCKLFTDHKVSVLFHLHEGVEVSESQDAQFAGRVHCDTDVLREGRIRLHVSRLRTEDSGLYLCKVLTKYGVSAVKSQLSVTAAADKPKPQRATVRPQPESPQPERPETRGRIGLYFALGLTAAALLAVPYSKLFAFSLLFKKIY
ncbi:coxsackievirus and adenovirus receptor homolog isoform X6 [Dicentrarchus labrax]|uniref:coxsackievirus and adenovirus receptor homolog isoform X6 n=1 Tax=Dicentrarchus labrax TaxID=13489 RepID=UPI0021F5EE88|nr:coxsackievirus and adenovirus receptor homolog isoform X6 [Dicentrarchus labrax]